MKKKRLLAGAVLLAVAFGIWLSGLISSKELVLTGMVTTDTVLVSSEVGGRLEKVLVKEGDAVQEGTLMATIQPREWMADVDFFASSEKQSASEVERSEAQLRSLRIQAREQVRQAEANLAAALALVKQTQADLENTELDLKRAHDLFEQKVVAAEVFDRARTTQESAAARLESARKQSDAAVAALSLSHSAEEQVLAQQAALESNRFAQKAANAQKEKAQTRLGYTKIVAPIKGIVDVRAALQGEVVNSGQPVFTLINPENLWVRADVEETYIDRIKIGDRFKVRLPSGKEMTGTVTHRGVNADYATQRDVSRSKRDIRTFEIRLRCDGDAGVLAAGMTAYVVVPLTK